MPRRQAFRTTQWDPLLIIVQIISLQTLYYTSISVIVLFTLVLTGEDITLDLLLDYRAFRSDTVLGWTLAFAWIANSVVGVYLLVRLIQRARLVLDFTVTLHIFHLILTTYYSGQIPTTFVWWALNVTTCCLMTFAGELYCMRREMEPIMLGSGGGGGSVGGDGSDDRGVGSDVTIAIHQAGPSAGAAIEPVSYKGKTSGETDARYEMVPMEEIM